MRLMTQAWVELFELAEPVLGLLRIDLHFFLPHLAVLFISVAVYRLLRPQPPVAEIAAPIGDGHYAAAAPSPRTETAALRAISAPASSATLPFDPSNQFDPSSPSTADMWWHSPMASAAEKEMIALAVPHVSADLKPLPALAHIGMLRQLRALGAKATPAGIADGYGKALRWRREHCPPLPGGRAQVWAASDELSEGRWAKNYVQIGVCIGRSRGGHPVKLERIGAADLVGVANYPGGEGKMLTYYQSLLEVLMTALDAESAASGRLLRMYEIFDFASMSLRNANFTTVRFTNSLMKVIIGVYAETTARAALINVPWVVAGILRGILAVLPERVAKRVIVLGEGEPYDFLYDDLDELAKSRLFARPEILAAHRGSSFEGVHVPLGSDMWPELRRSGGGAGAENGGSSSPLVAPDSLGPADSPARRPLPLSSSPGGSASGIEEYDVAAAAVPGWMKCLLPHAQKCLPGNGQPPKPTPPTPPRVEYRGSLLSLLWTGEEGGNAHAANGHSNGDRHANGHATNGHANGFGHHQHGRSHGGVAGENEEVGYEPDGDEEALPWYASLKELSASHMTPETPFSMAPCSAELCRLAYDDLRAFVAACEPDVLEATWASAPIRKQGGGITVRARPRADSRSLMYRIDATFYGVSAREIEACFAYRRRYGWDKEVHSGTNLTAPVPLDGSPARHRGEGPPSPRGTTTVEVDLNASCTYPALAGMVAARAFIDLRAVSVSVREDGLETHHSAQQALPARMLEATPAAREWAATAAAEQILLARNCSGGGSRMVEYRLEDGTLAVELLFITATELGGNLPTELVNGATPPALHNLISKLAKYLHART